MLLCDDTMAASGVGDFLSRFRDSATNGHSLWDAYLLQRFNLLYGVGVGKV